MGGKLQTRPTVFHRRHHGEHRLLLGAISPLAVLPERRLTRTTPKGRKDRLKIRTQETHPRSQSWRVQAGIWIRVWLQRGCSNFQVCSDHMRSNYRLSQVSNMGNWTISEVNSFFLSVDVNFAYSVPGTALGTRVFTATNKTEVSGVVALWMDEKNGVPIVHLIYLLAHEWTIFINQLVVWILQI